MTIALAGQIAIGAGLFAAIAASGLQLLANATAADRHLAHATAVAPAGAPGAQAHAVAGPAAAPAGNDNTNDGVMFGQLQDYYAANIKQGNTLFWATLLAMCLGFAIVFTGVVSAGINSTTAIVAAVAGVLSQFIAATFLVALRSTQQQATTYAQTLVELHLRDTARAATEANVRLGLALLAEMTADTTNPVNSTKAAIAAGLIVGPGVALPESPPPAVGMPRPDDAGAERRTRPASTVTFEDTPLSERR